MTSATLADGKYRLLRELGRGGSAHVYVGVAQCLGGFNKLVVLKILKRELCSDIDFRTMFLTEARLSARLSHPNVVQVNEVLSEDGTPIIVMEYLEGASLYELRRKAGAALTRDAEIKLIADSLNGLHYSHELKDFDGKPFGVVHRDMTPHNLFVTFDGQVKVLDFGIAKLNESPIETQVGVIKGKIRYMPPEQLAGERVDRRVDVFAAGVMLWEAACGRRLWQDLSEAAIMNAVLRGDIPSPLDVAPDVPPDLEAIVMKALEYEREDRYPTAEALREALEGYLATRPNVSSREVGRLTAEIFAEEREAARREIDERLKAEAFSNFPVETDQGPDSLSRLSAPTMVTDSLVPDLPPARPKRVRRAVWSLALSAALLVVALGLMGDRRVSEATDHSSFPPVTQAVVTPPPKPAATTTSARTEAVPSATSVRETPASEQKPKPARAVRRVAAKPSATAAATASGPKHGCTPPYYVDAQGFKRYKAECL